MIGFVLSFGGTLWTTFFNWKNEFMGYQCGDHSRNCEDMYYDWMGNIWKIEKKFNNDQWNCILILEQENCIELQKRTSYELLNQNESDNNNFSLMALKF